VWPFVDYVLLTLNGKDDDVLKNSKQKKKNHLFLTKHTITIIISPDNTINIYRIYTLSIIAKENKNINSLKIDSADRV